jgi:predicted negative regulator of RcsB-dependent stress response
VTNQYEAGLTTAEAACRRFPGAAAMQRLRGDALSALGRKLDTIAAYDHALQLDPRDEAARTGRARCLEPR